MEVKKEMTSPLKDSKNRWVKYLVIKEELKNKTIEIVRQRILKLLDSAQILLDNKGHVTICMGLYTYAVEEYGKIVLLKKSRKIEGHVKVKYKQGFRDHNTKFRLAIKKLPLECTIPRISPFDPSIFDAKIFDTETIIADFRSRMSVFYTNFSESGDNIESVPPVNEQKLKIAISTLRKIVEEMTNNTQT
jgi:AbiV family abortive infection protein